MIDAIHDKLEATLLHSDHTEQSVTYMFVEMRKFLEKETVKKSFPLINFYGDWVVHAELDRDDAKKQLEEIERIFTGNRNKDVEVNVIDGIAPFVGFQRLRQDMEQFLTKYNFSVTIVQDDQWYPFLDQLLNIICDSPLKMKTAGSLIKEFSFKPPMGDGDVIFEIILNNGINFSQHTNFAYLRNL